MKKIKSFLFLLLCVTLTSVQAQKIKIKTGIEVLKEQHFKCLEGKRVGLITNDQAGGLVDTRLLRGQGFATEEIAGGCFCCRFNTLVEAAARHGFQVLSIRTPSSDGTWSWTVFIAI